MPVKDERGFTLPEVLTTVLILGILFSIATTSWLGVVESRRVDSAANQLAADMRLSHNRSTSQLTDWLIQLNPEREETSAGPDYILYKLNKPHPDGSSYSGYSVEETIQRTLPDNTKIVDQGGGNRFMEFNSDGSMVTIVGSPSDPVTVTEDGNPKREVSFVSDTSRIQID